MDLLLDAGNTRLKAATCEDRGLTPLPPIAWQDDPMLRDVAERWGEIDRPEHVWCANVAGPLRSAAITAWVERRWGLQARFLRVADSAAGVCNRYLRPDQLGIDRWLAAVAGYGLAHGAVCVVDCGTAINVEFVAASGDYLGGLIAPGAQLMCEALSHGTSALPAVELTQGTSIGRDTRSCIGAGVIHALGGFIDRVVATARAEFAAEPHWFITGGNAAMAKSMASVAFTEVPDLVLRGMALVKGGSP